MEFDWDAEKDLATSVRRGFDFTLAAKIFFGPILERQDTRRDYGEVRIQAIGQAANRILLVVYTDRDQVRRIISARPANRKERALWLNSFA